ncbi:MAG: aminodeoxychorismate synthase component I [Chloroflexia bacterium]|nr:aminodeoxychorismate synthase component I [Chloroflexia bacterium]
MSDPLLLFEFPGPNGCPRPLRFADPLRVIAAHDAGQVRPALWEAEAARRAGCWVAGYVAYDAAPGLDPSLETQESVGMPLVWLGVFAAPSSAPLPEGGAFRIGEWRPSIGADTWAHGVAVVREAIERGETYQANLSLRFRTAFAGDALAFYERLRRAQRSAYCAYLDLGRYQIVSASPELFFRTDCGQITTRPMKGTAPRGRWEEEDAVRAEHLLGSPKERAENLMIVDLLRSDLGRVARVGSVRVPELFTLERYPTVLQMTSTITADLDPRVTLEELFSALFPCGSVTGAPKSSTMRLIAALEDSPRGVYCGAVGYAGPMGEAMFSVPIRTAVVDTGTVEYGAGAGVTWDSDADAEYAEVRAKAAVLTEERPPFSLLETLKLEQGRYVLLERHLNRLLSSARHLDVPADERDTRFALDRCAREHSDGAWRVRVLVGEDATVRVEPEPLRPLPKDPLPVALATELVCREDRFLYHKTTHRSAYERLRTRRPEVYDVLLRNEEGELTEFTTGNLVAEIDGALLTPPRACGLLAGTLRAELLESGRISEGILRPNDLDRASRLWLINGVRGWVPVHIVE